MISILFIAGISLIFLIILVVLWFKMDKVYDAQLNIESIDSFYFFLFGISTDIYDKENWIKNQKRYLLKTALFTACITILGTLLILLI